MTQLQRQQKFHVVLIKPSHYDDDGYVIQWFRSSMPSNSLAVLYGLAADCADRQILGPNVDIEIEAADETNTRIVPEAIVAGRRGEKTFVCLVGVQSNQFPRAVDLALRFRALAIPVAIGGFHVSGSLAMLPQMPVELVAAVDAGITLFAGEAEDGLDELLTHAWLDRLAPVYNHMAQLPNLAGVPLPFLPQERVQRTAGSLTTFDAGRGCPFQCSFCTIINVQGRVSRRRTADDVEAIVRRNVAQGVRSFFITDDNFARNKDWEKIFDRLSELRERDGLKIKLMIQVDTLCHRIPNFISKAKRAGVGKVFIGLESIDPGTLVATKKKQNRIPEYRTMLQAWKKTGAIIYAGYILGFPTDTPESIRRQIDIVQRELPIDFLEFFILTPLPGSEDHQKLAAAGTPMDDDLKPIRYLPRGDSASADDKRCVGGNLPSSMASLLFAGAHGNRDAASRRHGSERRQDHDHADWILGMEHCNRYPSTRGRICSAEGAARSAALGGAWSRSGNFIRSYASRRWRLSPGWRS